MRHGCSCCCCQKEHPQRQQTAIPQRDRVEWFEHVVTHAKSLTRRPVFWRHIGGHGDNMRPHFGFKPNRREEKKRNTKGSSIRIVWLKHGMCGREIIVSCLWRPIRQFEANHANTNTHVFVLTLSTYAIIRRHQTAEQTPTRGLRLTSS